MHTSAVLQVSLRAHYSSMHASSANAAATLLSYAYCVAYAHSTAATSTQITPDAHANLSTAAVGTLLQNYRMLTLYHESCTLSRSERCKYDSTVAVLSHIQHHAHAATRWTDRENHCTTAQTACEYNDNARLASLIHAHDAASGVLFYYCYTALH
eukprot:2595-Heterococcus_DN1.PRE.3